MDIYKGRRVLNAASRVVALDQPRKEFTDMPYHERYANDRSERAARELEDKALVAAFVTRGGKVKHLKASAKLVRREQHFGRITIPAIHRPVFSRKGGVCAGYVYDL